MKRNGNKPLAILGWILMIVAVAFFCLQLGYLLVHERFQVEYIDRRLFYIINIFIFVCLYIGIALLFTSSRKFKAISISVLLVLITINGIMFVETDKEMKHIVSFSPDFKHVFSIKKNIYSGEAIFYRSYYGILARPKEKLPNEIIGDVSVKWLEKDIAALTFQTNENKVQQFIGTYGDRSNGLSYYEVGTEIQGEWLGEDIKVISGTDGIHVTEHGKSTLFEWDHIHQYGTLAVVLEQDEEAVWTIGLNENFNIASNTSEPQMGNILLYKASIGNEEVFELDFQPSNN